MTSENKQNVGRSEPRTQWHPALCPALRVVCDKWNKHLTYLVEHQLGSKPNIVDLLIIKKDPNITIPLAFLNNFRTHNLIEFKSPDDGLNIHDLYKGIGYASEYQSQGHKDDIREPSEITLTLLRETRPEEMLANLAKQGRTITNTDPGVYIVEKEFPFFIQVVAYRELQDRADFLWLRALTSKLCLEDAHSLLDVAIATNKTDELKKQQDIDSVLYVCGMENHELFISLRKENDMGKLDSLKFIFEDDFKRIEQESKAEGIMSVTLNMLKEKFTLDQIVRATGFTIPEVKHLAAKHGLANDLG